MGKKKTVFQVLKLRNRIAECDSTAICKVEGCNQRHHPLLYGASRVFLVNPSTSSSTTPASKPQAKTNQLR